jgi:probable rRNA maturation factor
MTVTAVRRCRVPGVSLADVRRDAQRLLGALEEDDGDLVVSLVGDREMRRLNRDYRGQDRATDVLAFAMREGERAPGDHNLLGDVVISLHTAAAQARQDRVPLAAAVRRLLIHGVLHLLGYDHERSAAENRRMKAMERRLVGKLAAAGPCPPAARVSYKT